MKSYNEILMLIGCMVIGMVSLILLVGVDWINLADQFKPPIIWAFALSLFGNFCIFTGLLIEMYKEKD